MGDFLTNKKTSNHLSKHRRCRSGRWGCCTLYSLFFNNWVYIFEEVIQKHTWKNNFYTINLITGVILRQICQNNWIIIIWFCLTTISTDYCWIYWTSRKTSRWFGPNFSLLHRLLFSVYIYKPLNLPWMFILTLPPNHPRPSKLIHFRKT